MRWKKICSLLILLHSCQPVQQGYSFKGLDLKQIKIGKSSKKDIDNLLGSPTFDYDNSYCYIGANATSVMFLRFYRPKYQILCIKFDSKDIVETITNKIKDNIAVNKDKISLKQKLD
jgi:outer membrane protein assembly factor BamE (lipoprotein component of BamABCDE complex)